MFSSFKIFLCLVSLTLAMGEASAHEPFECSSRATVTDDRLEILITMGVDAAKQILTKAEFSSEAVHDAVRGRDEQGALPLPVTLATRFFALYAGVEEWAAIGVRVYCPGMEVCFVLDFPRPKEGPLEFRATYFEQVKEMARGPLSVMDHASRNLGGVMLSPANVRLQLSVPAVANNPALPDSP